MTTTTTTTMTWATKNGFPLTHRFFITCIYFVLRIELKIDLKQIKERRRRQRGGEEGARRTRTHMETVVAIIRLRWIIMSIKSFDWMTSDALYSLPFVFTMLASAALHIYECVYRSLWTPVHFKQIDWNFFWGESITINDLGMEFPVEGKMLKTPPTHERRCKWHVEKS